MSVVVLKARPTPELPDGVKLTLEQALQSETIKNLIEDFGGNVSQPIPLNEDQDNNTIQNVFNFMDLYNVEQAKLAAEKAAKVVPTGTAVVPAQAAEVPEEKPNPIDRAKVHDWEKNFFDKLYRSLDDGKTDLAPMFNFMLAANYLIVKPATDAVCKYTASLIKGKTPEDMLKVFQVQTEPIKA